MYEDFFGLKKSPFRDKATGPNVFVGPLTARTMAGFRKALTAQDAVVTVSGLAGTGKTTLVTRSVDAFDVRKKIVRVSRMRMEATDVLESLLIVLGVQDYPAGTIQRFTALRRKIKEFEDAGVRVFVIVEDALRTGSETLAEIEALTAADAGESNGASIVLMGDERLAEFMKAPELAQLQQRVRQRHRIEPLSAPELSGYLRHCFRLAGGDFDLVFDSKSCALLHHLSGGIPRVTNNIVDAALSAAATQGIRPVTAELVAKVAADEFQLDAGDFDFSADEKPEAVAAPEAIVEPEPELAPEPEALPELAAEPEPLPELAAEPEPLPELAAEPEPLPELAAEPESLPELSPEPESLPEFATEAEVDSTPEPVAEAEPVIVFSDADEDDEIPELIQDTLPDLAVLAPDLAEPEASLPEEEPTESPDESKVDTMTEIPKLQLEDAAELIADDVPELEQEPEPEPESVLVSEPLPEPALSPAPELELATEESSGDDVPDWERDPTLAELKPDLAALEQAMAVAHGANTPIDDVDEQATTIVGDEPLEEIPEITLDDSIRTGIEQQQPEDPAVELPQREPGQADAELEKIAAELAKAKTLEDVDDKMAETLFGSEISMIAAQVIGNPPTEEPANDSQPEAASALPPTPEPVEPEMAPQPADIASMPAAEEVSIETHTPTAGSGMDLSASQRLKTVRALNADLHPSLREPGNDVAANGSPDGGVTPESIEDQINTSITETLKALKVPPSVANEDGDEETGKSGFFSRFKRS